MKTKDSSEFSKFNGSIKKILSVSPDDLKQREQEWRRQRKQDRVNRTKKNKAQGNQ